MPMRHALSTTNLALVAVFAGLIAASTLWPGAELLSGVPITLQTLAVLLAGSGVAYVKLRPPMVAVAGRSHIALTSSIARLTELLEQTRRDAEAERAKATQDAGIVFEPGDLPNAKPTKKKGTGGAVRPPPDKPPAKHGGVGGPGF